MQWIVLFLIIFVNYFAGNATSGDHISGIKVIDGSGKNTCKGDMDCFINPPVDVTLEFTLVLGKGANNPKYKVSVDGVLNEELTLCKGGKDVTLEKSCKNGVVPTGKHTVSTKLKIPLYKDYKMLEISGPNKADKIIGLMSEKSSHPPATICNPKNGAC